MLKKMLHYFFLSLPLIFFLGLVLFFWQGLNINPQIVPSPLINKAVPIFELPELEFPKKSLNQNIFKGHISLLNVFASWCEACALEHPFLVDMAQNEQIRIYGLDYKDNRQSAMAYLKKYENPYIKIFFDKTGQAAINWGVYGTPETFIIDKEGIIRYKQIGPITSEVWHKKLEPILLSLMKKTNYENH